MSNVLSVKDTEELNSLKRLKENIQSVFDEATIVEDNPSNFEVFKKKADDLSNEIKTLEIINELAEKELIKMTNYVLKNCDEIIGTHPDLKKIQKNLEKDKNLHLTIEKKELNLEYLFNRAITKTAKIKLNKKSISLFDFKFYFHLCIKLVNQLIYRSKKELGLDKKIDNDDEKLSSLLRA